MPIQIKCPQCGNNLTAPDSLAGKLARCPKCKLKMEVPAAPAEKPAVKPPAAQAAKPAAKPASKPAAKPESQPPVAPTEELLDLPPLDDPVENDGGLDFLGGEPAPVTAPAKSPAPAPVRASLAPKPAAKATSNAPLWIALGSVALLAVVGVGAFFILKNKGDDKKVAESADTKKENPAVKKTPDNSPPETKPEPSTPTKGTPVKPPDKSPPPEIKPTPPAPVTPTPVTPTPEPPVALIGKEVPAKIAEWFGNDLRWLPDNTQTIARNNFKKLADDPLCQKYKTLVPAVGVWFLEGTANAYQVSLLTDAEYTLSAMVGNTGTTIIHFREPKPLEAFVNRNRRYQTRKIGDRTVYTYATNGGAVLPRSFFLADETTLVEIADAHLERIIARDHGAKFAPELIAMLERLQADDLQALAAQVTVIENAAQFNALGKDFPKELVGNGYGQIVRGGGTATVLEVLLWENNAEQAQRVDQLITAQQQQAPNTVDGLMLRSTRCEVDGTFVKMSTTVTEQTYGILASSVKPNPGNPENPTPNPTPQPNPQPNPTPPAVAGPVLEVSDKQLAQDTQFFPHDTCRVQRINCARLAAAKLIEQYADCASLWSLFEYAGEGGTLKLNYSTDVETVFVASDKTDVHILHLTRAIPAADLYNGREFTARNVAGRQLHVLAPDMAFFQPDPQTIVAGSEHDLTAILQRRAPAKLRSGAEKLLQQTNAAALYWEIDATDGPVDNDNSLRGLLRELAPAGSLTQIECGATLEVKVEQSYRDSAAAAASEKWLAGALAAQKKKTNMAPAAKELQAKLKVVRDGSSLKATWIYDGTLLDKLRKANYLERAIEPAAK